MIQSAEEFARLVYPEEDQVHDREYLVRDIRLRDKETVEACREMVRVTPIYIPGDGKREPLTEGFDAILRDLS